MFASKAGGGDVIITCNVSKFTMLVSLVVVGLIKVEVEPWMSVTRPRVGDVIVTCWSLSCLAVRGPTDGEIKPLKVAIWSACGDAIITCKVSSGHTGLRIY